VRRARSWVAVLLVSVAAVAVLVILGTREHYPHRLSTTVPDATNVVRGQLIREAGQRVGEIRSVTPVNGGRAVRLELAFEDAAWPLPRGSRFTLRWGGTVSYDNRYIALKRGPAGTPTLPERATLTRAQFRVPVEFDQLLSAFTPKVRRDTRTLLNRGGIAFGSAEPALRRTLSSAPPALAQLNGVIGDLNADTRSLDTLVRATGSVVDAVQRANPGIGALVQDAATTFTATASQVSALQTTLQRTPHTLIAARATLAHADGTLTSAGDLAQKLAPGVSQVRKIAAPLNHVLGTVVDVGPDAEATLRTARRSTPTVNQVLDKATALSPAIASIGTQTVKQVKCIRPYTPDIIAFFTNWGDFLSATDGRDKYIRATVQQFLPSPTNVSTNNSADIAKAWPGLRYAFPRPPGYNAGQTWFLPECGAGPDALNPAKDPESRTYNPLGRAPRLELIGAGR
jgi:ABC-type transporter Mla subunit MlaD